MSRAADDTGGTGTKRRRDLQHIAEGRQHSEVAEHIVAAGPRQHSIDMQQAAGDPGHAAKVAKMRLQRTGTETGLPTLAQGGAKLMESAGECRSTNAMPEGDGWPQEDPPAKPKFRQKKQPTVHNTTRKSGSYRATQRGIRGKQLDSESGHKTTLQPKTQDPQ